MKHVRFLYVVEKFGGDSILDYLSKENVKIRDVILARDNVTRAPKGYGFFRMTDEDYVYFNPVGLLKSNSIHDDWYIN